jgi:hypothetical protein
LGLGTTSPSQLLHLYKSSGTILLTLQSSTNYGYFYNDGTNIGLASNIGSTGYKLIVNRNAPDSSLVIASTGAATFSSSVSLNAVFNSTTNTPYIRFDESSNAKFFIGQRGAVSGDGGTGYDLYTVAGNDLRFFAGGTKALTLATSGAATFSSSVTAGASYLSSGNAVFGVTSNSSNMYIGGGSFTPAELWLQAGTSFMRFDVNGSERMRITSAGNVNIGTSNPSARKLSIGGEISIGSDSSNTYELIVQMNSSYARIGPTYQTGGSYVPLTFWTSDAERMRITSGGDIGIGNTGDASVRLFVSGKDTSSNNYAALFRNSSGNNLLGVKNSGRINMGSLPTSSAGLSSGDLYVAAGVLMIV